MDSMAQQARGGLESDVPPEVLKQQVAIEQAMRLAALNAARSELFRMARRRQISDDVCREAVRRIDLQEARGARA